MARQSSSGLATKPTRASRASAVSTINSPDESMNKNRRASIRTTRSRMSNGGKAGADEIVEAGFSSNKPRGVEVVVPVRSEGPSAPSKGKGKARPSRATVVQNSSDRSSTPLSSASSVPGSGSSSAGYDTPGTSIAATPRESTSKRRSTSSKAMPGGSSNSKSEPPVNVRERIEYLRKTGLSMAYLPGKRKRAADEGPDAHFATDAELAQRLQDEENMMVVSDEEEEEEEGEDESEEDEPEEAEARPSRRSRRPLVESDDSDDTLGTLGLPTAVATPLRGATRSKNAQTPKRPPLPSRTARNKAQKSISSTNRSKIRIDDSEESDVELSELDSDAFEEEEKGDVNEGDEGDASSSAVNESDEIEAPAAPVPTRPATDRAPRRSQARRRGRNARNNDHAADARTSRKFRERLSLGQQHSDFDTMWEDLQAQPVIRPVAGPQPKSITRKLKGFQLEGLDWMMKQEATQWRGGLLGDEMGMGKTIQAVSLIMSDYPARTPTLVIVPPVALVQWQNEIREYTDGKLKVLLYHGPQVKKMSVKQLMDYDVLMTSYSTLEVTHRKERKGWSRKDEDGERFLIKSNSPLHTIKFHRVILDEAHNIKSRTSGTAKACFALKADFKWCLSGTPLQNRIGELFSLLRFLNVQPFACYMCKSCSCKDVQWNIDTNTRKCTVCRHRGFDHVSIFNLELLHPIIAHGNSGPGKEAFGKLRLLMERIMLRRMKVDHTTSMELPAKDIVIHTEFFGEIERDFASSIMTNTARQFDTYVAQGVMLNNYANIFGLIMQMRQVADHPDMILRKHAEGGQNILVCCICDDAAEDCIRSACRHDFCRTCVRNYMRSFEDEQDPDCPRCHIPLSIDLEQEEREQDEDAVKKSSIINRIKMENWTSSTKIEMLIYELAELRSSKRTIKSIVFSQFTSMLQLVEWRLRRAGFNTVMLDGTMTPVQRQSSIDYFMKNPDCEVFLVSLKAGGVALNLTEASNVFLIDPWWNPAAEWQSADRCHRIGQGRPCTIKRLCIEDSVESRMVLLQEKKANMINGTINSDETAMQNLSTDDMQFLFRGT